jgi:hypothetical protein
MPSNYPNETHYPMSEDQEYALTAQIAELEAAGRLEEAERLEKTIPVGPIAAKPMKKQLGLEYMLSEGLNLYEAILTYGEQFLEP